MPYRILAVNPLLAGMLALFEVTSGACLLLLSVTEAEKVTEILMSPGLIQNPVALAVCLIASSLGSGLSIALAPPKEIKWGEENDNKAEVSLLQRILLKIVCSVCGATLVTPVMFELQTITRSSSMLAALAFINSTCIVSIMHQLLPKIEKSAGSLDLVDLVKWILRRK